MRCGNREAKLRNSRRELIAPKESKRYVQRNRQGEFKKEVSVGRSLTSDWGRHAKTQVPKGQGDHGDTVWFSIIAKLFQVTTNESWRVIVLSLA
jgi:hypothetical protein